MIVPAKVELSPVEFHMAVNSALLQVTASALENRNHKKTMDRNRMEILHHSVVGAIGEIAFAKWANRFFVPSCNTFHNIPDCFEDVEVRCSDKNLFLITRDDDAPDRRYVKVMTNGNSALVVGWLFGHEAKQDKWFKSSEGKRDCWMTPHSELKQIETIYK